MINQYLVSSLNSPYIYLAVKENASDSHSKVNHFLALHIVIQSGWLDVLDKLIQQEMEGQVLSIPSILQEKALKIYEGSREQQEQELSDKEIDELNKIFEREQQRLVELQKRRVKAFDKCLLLQLDAQIQRIEAIGIQNASLKLSEPSKMLIANCPSLQKKIQSGLDRFKSLSKYKEKLQKLSLQIYAQEDKLLDELMSSPSQ